METNIWTYCDSLRYGFDDTYDIPTFDEEEETENDQMCKRTST